MMYVPPVTLRSSLQEMPLPLAEVTVSVPVPFNTMSSREKITASVLVSPSARNSPVTERVLFESVVVMKHLSTATM